MDLALQSKLLRFVQTGTFQQVGGNKIEKVDVRFICATNRDPLEMVAKGTFREDLYYRLHVIPIHLPALRECGNDVMLIAKKYLREYADEEGKNFEGFTPEAAFVLSRYQWPGNVRQLQNILRNIVVLQNGELVTQDLLPALLSGLENTGPSEPDRPLSDENLAQSDICVHQTIVEDRKRCHRRCHCHLRWKYTPCRRTTGGQSFDIYRKRLGWEDE